MFKRCGVHEAKTYNGYTALYMNELAVLRITFAYRCRHTEIEMYCKKSQYLYSEIFRYNQHISENTR